VGGEPIGAEINARLWVLNLSDGEHSLLDIADRSAIPFAMISDAADLLFESGLLKTVQSEHTHETGRRPLPPAENRKSS
jgi:aminopeptidase-like protein